MVPLVSVIIANWNGLRFLKPCLQALERQHFKDFEIIVVDNGSQDGSVEWLSQQPGVRLIRNASNKGFAEANNQGIRASHSPFVALLNNDTEAVPEWLDSLVLAMQDPAVGMAASLMCFADHPKMVQSAGIAIDQAAISWDRFGGMSVEYAEVQQDAYIFGPSGGAALYRRAMLDEIGWLDERFFAYLEDVDLAWRAQCAGWRCRYVPEAVVLHHTSATSGEGSPFKQRLLGRNKLFLVIKNAPLTLMPAILVYDLLAVIYALLTRRSWHHAQGRLAALPVLPEIWRERRSCSVNHGYFLQSLVFPWQVSQRYSHLYKYINNSK